MKREIKSNQRGIVQILFKVTFYDFLSNFYSSQNQIIKIKSKLIMPRHTRSRRSHYNVHWNLAMMDELVDIRQDRNRAYHNINGRSRYDFWDSVANRFI